MASDDVTDVTTNAPTDSYSSEFWVNELSAIRVNSFQGQQQPQQQQQQQPQQQQQQQPFAASPDIGQLQMQNAERMFQSQLQELQSMGFPDRRRNLQGTLLHAFFQITKQKNFPQYICPHLVCFGVRRGLI